MKKLFLSMFLLFSTIIFAGLPDWVDEKEVKAQGYKAITEASDAKFTLKKPGRWYEYHYEQHGRISINDVIDEIQDIVTAIALRKDNVKEINMFDFKKTYIEEYHFKEGYIYAIFLRFKFSDCFLVVLDFNGKKRSESELNELSEEVYNQAVRFVKEKYR